MVSCYTDVSWREPNIFRPYAYCPAITATNNAVYTNIKYKKEWAIQLHLDTVVIFSDVVLG